MLLIVSEIGINHDGRWDRAHEMIRRSAEAGADIAKFQFGWRDGEDEINHITPSLAAKLRDWCEFWGVEFMASIISPAGFEIARPLEPHRYKIASRTVVDRPELVEAVLAEGRETFVSLGWWSEEEQGRRWPFGPPGDRLRYIYCKSSYPTYPADLRDLPERFSDDGYYGFSDHFMGIEASLLAIARGARFVEKHFTLDKTHRSVHNDHVLSADPDELARLSRVGRPLARVTSAVLGRGPAPSGWSPES